MIPKHLFLCGGVPSVARRNQKAIRLDTSGNNENIHLKISDVTEAMVADLPPILADLLEVAAYVYCADQTVSRGGKKAIDYGVPWRRAMQFAIPVRCPDRWSRPGVADALAALLTFLADDASYEFTFVKLQHAPPMSHYLEFDGSTPNTTGIEEVCLFSGGLDSLGGAVREIITDRRKVALVSHRSNPKLNTRQKTLITQLAVRAEPGRGPLHVPIWLNKSDVITHDYTQRTRSFLYASMATIIAALFRLNRIRFYENGPISLNLPICEQVNGGRATRTTHPKTMASFERLFSLLLDESFTVENPFLLMTKAEVITGIKAAGQADLIKHSVSCPHTKEITKLHTHCGRCSQCIDRRFATLASGCAADDPEDMYKVKLFTGPRDKTEDRTMVERYVGTAARIGQMKDAEEFFSTPPFGGPAADALRHMRGGSDKAASNVFNLMQRHSQAVCKVVNEAVAAHAPDYLLQSLPATCLLMLVPKGLNPAPAPEPETQVRRQAGLEKQLRPHGKSKDRQEKGQIRERFGFVPGQALFDEQDLGLPSGLAIDVLRKLVESWGRPVKHPTLDSDSTGADASDQLRAAVSRIRKELKAKKVPCNIKAKRGMGYVIS
jgi:hypothetical protein